MRSISKRIPTKAHLFCCAAKPTTFPASLLLCCITGDALIVVFGQQFLCPRYAINLALNCGLEIQHRFGTYRVTIPGKSSSGAIACGVSAWDWLYTPPPPSLPLQEEITKRWLRRSGYAVAMVIPGWGCLLRHSLRSRRSKQQATGSIITVGVNWEHEVGLPNSFCVINCAKVH